MTVPSQHLSLLLLFFLLGQVGELLLELYSSFDVVVELLADEVDFLVDVVVEDGERLTRWGGLQVPEVDVLHSYDLGFGRLWFDL